MIVFETSPEKYRHWRLTFEGEIAFLSLDVQEDAPLKPEYRLKLNSYDLGVDIELADAVERLRFEYPEVKVVVLRSAKGNVFCAGANIFMLGSSSHFFKVNFCKASILHRQVIGPHEMETRFGLIGGNIFHGELSASQLFHMRPVPGYADFRTPVKGLYQASSATHGGGGVTGIPALQVVKRVLNICYGHAVRATKSATTVGELRAGVLLEEVAAAAIVVCGWPAAPGIAALEHAVGAAR